MPLKLISEIRNSFADSVYVYTNGSCWEFYKILKCVYPEAEAYYNSDHVITKINGKFYDITGEVECTKLYLTVDGNYSIKMMEKAI